MSACVVVLDDEPMLLELVRDILTMEGHESIGFSHPYEMDAFSSHTDLFILDIMLPDRTGVEVAQRLRDGGYAQTPMIAMSASPLMLRLAKESGLFQDMVSKPFGMTEFLDCVSRYVRR